jgi:hypothetical protein
MISDANKLLTRKTTGPWVFPDDWRGKSRANEVVTGTLLSHVGGTITYNISGGVPNTAFTSTTEPAYGGGFGWTWNDYADGYGIPGSNLLQVGYGGTVVFTQSGGARQDTVTYVVVGDYTYFRGAFLYSTNVYNDLYTDYVESYYNVYAVYHGTLNVLGNYSFNDNAIFQPGSHSVTFAFAATGRTRIFNYTSYAERVDIGPTSVQVGVSFDIYVSGGAPNTVVRKRLRPTDFPLGGPFTEYTLDSSGAYAFTEQIGTAGSWRYDFYFVATGYLVTESIGSYAGSLTISGTSSISFSEDSNQLFSELTYTTNGTAPISWSSSGAFPGGVTTYSMKYAGDPNYYIYQASTPYYTHPTVGTYNITLTATDALGAIGTFAVTITVDPASPTYPAAGTVLSEGCVAGTYTYRVTKADGSGGSYNEDTPNSAACGYVAPSTNRYDANNYWVMQMANEPDFGTNIYSNYATAYWDGVAIASFNFGSYGNGPPYDLVGHVEAGSDGGSYYVGDYVTTDVNGWHQFRIIRQ